VAETSVTIDFDQEQLNRVKADMSGIKNGANKVLNRSIAKTLTNVQADTVNRLFGTLNLKKGFIKNGDTKKRYHKGVKKFHSYPNITGKVYSIGVRVPLIYFGSPSQLKSGKGVNVKVLRSGSLTLLKHAFIATMKSGHASIFWRQKLFGRKWIKGYPYAAMADKPYKLPVEQLLGPRVQDFMAKKETILKIQANADYRLLFNMEHELDYMLDRLP
jgi:hypothetical protein